MQRLQAAVAANPDDARALNDLGQILVRLGRAQEALPYFDRAVRAEPDSWAYQFNRARAYAQLQQWAPAVDGIRVAARLFPDDYATQYNPVQKRCRQAGIPTRRSRPTSERFSSRRGSPTSSCHADLALEAAKRPRDAAEAYRRYLELEPQAPDAEKVKAHLAELEPATTAPAACRFLTAFRCARRMQDMTIKAVVAAAVVALVTSAASASAQALGDIAEERRGAPQNGEDAREGVHQRESARRGRAAAGTSDRRVAHAPRHQLRPHPARRHRPLTLPRRTRRIGRIDLTQARTAL